ncbi:MAG: hypothetical protein AAF628_13675 [Planctomycetota bacterium]
MFNKSTLGIVAITAAALILLAATPLPSPLVVVGDPVCRDNCVCPYIETHQGFTHPCLDSVGTVQPDQSGCCNFEECEPKSCVIGAETVSYRFNPACPAGLCNTMTIDYSGFYFFHAAYAAGHFTPPVTLPTTPLPCGDFVTLNCLIICDTGLALFVQSSTGLCRQCPPLR